MTKGKDKLLESVGNEMAAVLAEEALDPRWEEVAAGHAESAVVDELCQDAEDPRLLEVLRPLDESLKVSLTDELMAKAGPAPAPIPFSKSGRRRALIWAGAGGGLALAASLLLLLRPQGAVDLPAYTSAFEGGDQAVRKDSPTGDIPILRPSSLVTWQLRPQQKVSPPPEVSLYWRQFGELRRLDGPLEVSDQGAVRIQGTAAELGLERGEGELVLILAVVGTTLPPPDQIPSETWRRFVQPLQIVPEPSP